MHAGTNHTMAAMVGAMLPPAGGTGAADAARRGCYGPDAEEVDVGLGCIVALHHRSSTSYYIHSAPLFLKRSCDQTPRWTRPVASVTVFARVARGDTVILTESDSDGSKVTV